MAIVAVPELGHGDSDLLDVLEDAAIDRLLLQRPVEAFGNAVGLRLSDKGEARRNTPEPHLVEEVVGGVLRAVVHAQRQAASGVGAGGAELGPQPLGNRLQGGKTVADLDRVHAHAVSIEMIDGREHPDPALVERLDPDAIGAPHLVGTVGLDRTVVRDGLAPRPPMRRQQRVLAHQTQHAGARDADVAQNTQPCPDLAMAFAGERRRFEISANGRQQLGIRYLGLRAASLRVQGHHLRRFASLLGVERRARKLEHPTDTLQAVTLAGLSGGLAAHRDDLRPAKGRLARLSFCRISTSMTSSPMRRLASSSCFSTGSFSRSLRPASIPASARSRHRSSLYIGTDTSREMASTGSPRNSRSTTSFFRPADHRFTSAAAPGSPPLALRAP